MHIVEALALVSFCWCLLVVFCILSAKLLMVPPCHDVRFTGFVFSDPVEVLKVLRFHV